MKKLTKLPREEAAKDADGPPASGDVEAHGMPTGPETHVPRLPGTGGDIVHRPTTGGELTSDDDVEAHGMQPAPETYAPTLPGTGGDSLLPGMPGTGGDAVRRPVGTGDAGSQDDIAGTPAR
jgi:hypothetical protein